MKNALNLSVIIPAYNAGHTVTDTLECLMTQTYPDWEAIVVDDGSTDATLSIATALAYKDNRIRVISQSNQGVSAARNAGIGLAGSEWILFMDADDWISSRHMENMMGVLAADQALDAVVCGWNIMTPDNYVAKEGHPPQQADLFPALVRYCPFVIHACIVRKSFVRAAGGFDLSWNVCEDWDLWQRVARSGARFGFLKEVHAFYRMRPKSLSRNVHHFFLNAKHIITRGYGYDPRVLHPLPQYQAGLKPDHTNRDLLYCASWCAGLFIAEGKEAGHLLDLIHGDVYTRIDAGLTANNIFESVYRCLCQLPAVWQTLWLRNESSVKSFLSALEKKSHSAGLAKSALVALERLVAQHSTGEQVFSVGTTHVVGIEITSPILDVSPPLNTERLFCKINMEGSLLGHIELPVCSPVVFAWVIRDAIAARFAWIIMGRFFRHTIYSNQPTGSITENTHDQTGWTRFLQQLWDCQDYESESFYNPEFPDKRPAPTMQATQMVKIEVSSPLPNLRKSGKGPLEVLFTVGGIATGTVKAGGNGALIKPQELRTAITRAGGFELCRICVREALLGTPLHEPASIRARLTLAAGRHGSTKPAEQDVTDLRAEKNIYSGATLLERRNGLTGTSISRRAVLPARLVKELTRMAEITGEQVREQAGGGPPVCVFYAPEIVSGQGPDSFTHAAPQTDTQKTALYGRQHFETLFSGQPDPWKYTHPYEQTKYELTLSLLPEKRFAQATEIACAEGHFTVQLAPFVDSLVATDISRVALDRAAARCSNYQHIAFRHLDLIKDNLPGQADLVVCSEVLYYTGGLKELKAVARKLAQALNVGGYLLVAHAHQIIDEPDKPGFDWNLPFGAKVIGDIIARTPSLCLVKEIRTPLYRIQLFQRRKQTSTLR